MNAQRGPERTWRRLFLDTLLVRAAFNNPPLTATTYNAVVQGKLTVFHHLYPTPVGEMTTIYVRRHGVNGRGAVHYGRHVSRYSVRTVSIHYPGLFRKIRMILLNARQQMWQLRSTHICKEHDARHIHQMQALTLSRLPPLGYNTMGACSLLVRA